MKDKQGGPLIIETGRQRIKLWRAVGKWMLLPWLMLQLSGCGFHLKGNNSGFLVEIPVMVQAVPEAEAIQFQLQRRLLAAGATLVEPGTSQAPLQVLLQQPHLLRRVLARNSSGRPAEYLLQLRVTLDYKWQHQPPARRTFTAERVYRYSQEQLLATHREERLYVAEMQQQLADQITGYFSRLSHLPEPSQAPHAD